MRGGGTGWGGGSRTGSASSSMTRDSVAATRRWAWRSRGGGAACRGRRGRGDMHGGGAAAAGAVRWLARSRRCDGVWLGGRAARPPCSCTVRNSEDGDVEAEGERDRWRTSSTRGGG